MQEYVCICCIYYMVSWALLFIRKYVNQLAGVIWFYDNNAIIKAISTTMIGVTKAMMRPMLTPLLIIIASRSKPSIILA